MSQLHRNNKKKKYNKINNNNHVYLLNQLCMSMKNVKYNAQSTWLFSILIKINVYVEDE